MIEFVGFLVFCALFHLAYTTFDGTSSRWWRDCLVTLIVLSLVGGFVWETAARGGRLPFSW